MRAMQLCIYCQANPAETADHVPPKGLFKEPRPKPDNGPGVFSVQ